MRNYILIGGAAFIGLIVGMVMLWLGSKFFFRFLKLLLVVLMVGAIGSGLYIFRMTPARKPYVGKHAYLIRNGKYLGVVEGAGEDNRRGEVWIVRPPGKYPVMYAKSYVLLKDELDPKSARKETPASSPAAKNSP